jgi:hypothetical protein
MKDTYYFSHDYNTRTDVKIKRIIAKYGMLGYGVFWAIIEDLYNNANALPTDYESIAFDLRTNEMVVKSIINDFDLFIIDDDVFGSMSVQRRLDERNQKTVKARESANKRWEKKNNDANALQPQSDSNAIKESKVNENKENESKPPKQASDIVLFEIEENKNEKIIGFDCSNKSEDFKKYYNVTLTFLNQFIKTVKESGGTVNSLENSKIGTWVKPIRDLYVIDKIQSANIKLVFDNLPKDEFWSKNILSTSKLRKQFNTLIVKYNSKNKSNPNNTLTYKSPTKTAEQLEYEQMRLDALNNG